MAGSKTKNDKAATPKAPAKSKARTTKAEPMATKSKAGKGKTST